MKYNTVIFDMDGTLLNTLEDIHDGVNYAMKYSGYPLKTIDEVRKFVGNGAKQLIDRVVPFGTTDKESDECLKIYSNYYAGHAQIKTRPYDGILNLLDALKDNGYKLAVVSNKFDGSVKALCKDYFSEYIQTAIGESPNVARKPAPDSVFTAISELDSSIEDSIYIGDSEVDIHTAHNAGIPCVGVTWGFRDRELLQAEGAEFIINKPEELLNILFD